MPLDGGLGSRRIRGVLCKAGPGSADSPLNRMPACSRLDLRPKTSTVKRCRRQGGRRSREANDLQKCNNPLTAHETLQPHSPATRQAERGTNLKPEAVEHLKCDFRYAGEELMVSLTPVALPMSRAALPSWRGGPS